MHPSDYMLLQSPYIFFLDPPLSIQLSFPNGMDRQKERVLFKDALNTFYVRLYGIGHMLKDLSESERENLLPPHIGYDFQLGQVRF